MEPFKKTLFESAQTFSDNYADTQAELDKELNIAEYSLLLEYVAGDEDGLDVRIEVSSLDEAGSEKWFPLTRSIDDGGTPEKRQLTPITYHIAKAEEGNLRIDFKTVEAENKLRISFKSSSATPADPGSIQAHLVRKRYVRLPAEEI